MSSTRSAPCCCCAPAAVTAPIMNRTMALVIMALLVGDLRLDAIGGLLLVALLRGAHRFSLRRRRGDIRQREPSLDSRRAARRTGRGCVAPHELLELVSAIGADVFVDRHGQRAPAVAGSDTRASQ